MTTINLLSKQLVMYYAMENMDYLSTESSLALWSCSYHMFHPMHTMIYYAMKNPDPIQQNIQR
jgi:hypothetical protein